MWNNLTDQLEFFNKTRYLICCDICDKVWKFNQFEADLFKHAET